MQNMSCSLPSPEAIHATDSCRIPSCVMQITHTQDVVAADVCECNVLFIIMP